MDLRPYDTTVDYIAASVPLTATLELKLEFGQ
jgi:hypothetical protein